MDSFNALRCHKTNEGIEARHEQLTLDDLSEGEVVIRVCYSSVNYKDALAVTGKGKIMRDFPLNAGIDAAGVVESSDSDSFSAGDEVLVTGYGLGENRDGGFAEYLRVPGEYVVPLPDGLELHETMALGTAGFTAGFAVRRLLENNQTPALGPIAVTGATGGVGSFAVNILSRLGYEVTAITGKPKAAGDYLKGLGASEILDRREIDFEGGPLLKTQWGGAVDAAGGELLEWLTRTVVPYGNIASIGLAGGHKLNTTVMPFILRGVGLLGIHSVECPMDWRLPIWGHLSGDWKPDCLDTVVTETLDLKAIPNYCERMLAGEIQGRALVELNS